MYSKTTTAPKQSPAKRSHPDQQEISAAETQYDDRQYSSHRAAIEQQAQNEYLAFIQESERAALGQQAQQAQHAPQHSYGKLSASPETNGYYSRNPGHPLAGSSLEKEIEKLVSSNVHQYAPGPHGQHRIPVPHPQQEEIEEPSTQQPTPQFQQQQLRQPVLFKNPNEVVYIPYQQQTVPRDQYPRPAAATPGITKAKVQLFSPYQQVRAPLPSEAIEYGPGPAAPQFSAPPQRSQESFKELYFQQQRENQLKRLAAQEQHQQQHQHQQQQPQPQPSTDNVNLQSHSQPLSISLLPKKSIPTSPQPQPTHQLVQEQHQQQHQQQPQPQNPHIAQLAEKLFKTPLEEQKPLSQDEFKALVDAGYPVQAVLVPVATSSKGPAPPPSHGPSPHQIGRYAPSTVSISHHAQPFMQTNKQQSYPVQHFAPQVHRPASAAHHQVIQQRPAPNHHYFAQQAQVSQANQHTTYKYTNGGPITPQHGPYTYVLQQGENEETAADQLRQQILSEINAQSHKGTAQAAPQQSQRFNPGRTEYRQPAQTQQHQQIQTVATASQKPLTEEQKEYFKRLEYYSHNK